MGKAVVKKTAAPLKDTKELSGKGAAHWWVTKRTRKDVSSLYYHVYVTVTRLLLDLHG